MHGGLTSLAPHERLPELPIISRETPHTGAACFLLCVFPKGSWGIGEPRDRSAKKEQRCTGARNSPVSGRADRFSRSYRWNSLSPSCPAAQALPSQLGCLCPKGGLYIHVVGRGSEFERSERGRLWGEERRWPHLPHFCTGKWFILAWDQVPSPAPPCSSPHPQFVASETWMHCLLSLPGVFRVLIKFISAL